MWVITARIYAITGWTTSKVRSQQAGSWQMPLLPKASVQGCSGQIVESQPAFLGNEEGNRQQTQRNGWAVDANLVSSLCLVQERSQVQDYFHPLWGVAVDNSNEFVPGSLGTN